MPVLCTNTKLISSRSGPPGFEPVTRRCSRWQAAINQHGFQSFWQPEATPHGGMTAVGCARGARVDRTPFARPSRANSSDASTEPLNSHTLKKSSGSLRKVIQATTQARIYSFLDGPFFLVSSTFTVWQSEMTSAGVTIAGSPVFQLGQLSTSLAVLRTRSQYSGPLFICGLRRGMRGILFSKKQRI